MNSKKSKIIIVLLIALLLLLSASALAVYVQDCKQELREVDRYAQPYIIEVMEALSTWKYENIEPFLTDRFKAMLTAEEWQKDLDELSELGGLQSFGRPRFVSHMPFKKFFIDASAIEMYSVSTEYEKANAVVRLQFENACGKLKVNSFNVTSRALKQKPDYLNDRQPGDNDANNELLEDEIVEMDNWQEHADKQFEIDEDEIEQLEPSADTEIKAKKKPKGSVYRY